MAVERDYPHVFRREIYLYETDALGHVNNVSFIAYMEGARFDLFKRMGIFDPKDPLSLGLILARIECNYRREVRYGDTLLIYTRVEEVGRSSFTLGHILRKEGDGEVVAEGRATLVAYDYKAGRPRELSQGLLEKLSQYKGGGL